MRTAAALGALLLLGAASAAPVLHRVDSNDVFEGDGPVLVTVRSSVFTDEANDHFSARLVPDGENGGDWEPCTTSPTAFCHYEAGAKGLRILRFATMDAAGQLEIRYAAGDADPSEELAIDVGPALPDTPSATSKSADASPAPAKQRRVRLEISIDDANGGAATPAPAAKPEPTVQKPPQQKPQQKIAQQKPPQQRPPQQKPPQQKHVAQAPPPRPQTGPEFVHVTCSSVPLYADEHGTAIIAAGTVLVARGGDVFLTQRGTVAGRTGALRVLDLGARVYVDAGCVH